MTIRGDQTVKIDRKPQIVVIVCANMHISGQIPDKHTRAEGGIPHSGRIFLKLV